MGEKGLKWLEQLWQCFLSIVKILLQSKWRTRLPSSFSNPDELLILANGPSLNRTVEDSRSVYSFSRQWPRRLPGI